jgi:hypothetical protein
MSTAQLSRRVRLYRWYTDLSRPTQVWIRWMSIVILASAIGTGVEFWTGHQETFTSVFYGLTLGILGCTTLETYLRLKQLERMMIDGHIKELVAQLSNGRTIYVHDAQTGTTYQAPPPQRQSSQWN